MSSKEINSETIREPINFFYNRNLHFSSDKN